MPGNRSGGQKAAQTNKERYGEDFYKNLGRKGGLKSRGGGFRMYPELAVESGRKGGRISVKPNPLRDDCLHEEELKFEVGGKKYLKCVKCRKVRKK